MIKNRQLIFTFLLVLWSLGISAQSHLPDSPGYLMPLILRSKPDTNRIKLQLQLGSYYLSKPGKSESDLDSAFIFFNQAMQLSTTLRSSKWQNATLMFEGNIKSGKASLMRVIDFYHKMGDRKKEAETWVILGNDIPGFPNLLDDKALCFNRARLIYRGINDKLGDITMLKIAADIHLNQGKLDLSERELFDVLAQLKAIHYKKLQYSYDLLASVYNLKGELQKRLFYQLEAIKYAEATLEPPETVYFYLRAAKVYTDLGILDKVDFYCHKALSISKNIKDEYFIYELGWLTQDLILTNRSQEALRFLVQNARPVDSLTWDQRRSQYSLFGKCYTALKQYSKAERYYLAMVKIKEGFASLEQYLIIANFYVTTRQFKKAAFYLQKLKAFPASIVSPTNNCKIELMKFKVDSASGSYISAIDHFEIYKKVNDSLFNATKSKQISELGIKYETAQKEKSIEFLKSQSLVQHTKLQKANLQRNITLIGTSMLLIIAGLAYNGYRNKQRGNLKLKVKQNEINKQNLALQSLLGEKDWLLREIHHRVKNNLQTTISLLNMQSAYLSNDEALAAIRNSQRRMQAMSLIHQKLYQSETMTHVKMSDYVAELVSFLKESFGGSKEINFELNIQLAMLDVTQAIPLGLIINEAVTNAIKYAFPRNQKGKISMVLVCPRTSK
jgi:two-component sensor histidine kinase